MQGDPERYCLGIFLLECSSERLRIADGFLLFGKPRGTSFFSRMDLVLADKTETNSKRAISRLWPLIALSELDCCLISFFICILALASANRDFLCFLQRLVEARLLGFSDSVLLGFAISTASRFASFAASRVRPRIGTHTHLMFG